MRLPEQLQLFFTRSARDIVIGVAGQALRRPDFQTATGAVALQRRSGRDQALEARARGLLHNAGATGLAGEIRVEWNSRMRSCAGRADSRRKCVSLNPLLHHHGEQEIDRTLRHELAHLLAQFRAGRRRIRPHGQEWRQACHDLGIGDETRCHNLPFPVQTRPRRYLYRCPNCHRDFPRVRRIKRVVACLPCCRLHTRGKFAPQFRLHLVQAQ